jgi:hypothetical protein
VDAEIFTTVAGVAGAIKATIETARAVLAKGTGRAAESATHEALRLIGELQTRILQLQEIAFHLQEENNHLREQVRQHEEWATDRGRYERHHVGGSMVVVAKEDPKTYLCATCFEDGKKVYLSKKPNLLGSIGTHYCSKCGTVVGTR